MVRHKRKISHSQPPKALAPKDAPLASDARIVPSQDCLKALESLGSVTKELSMMLNMPKELFKTGTGFGRVSYSSEPDNAGDALATYLILNQRKTEFPQVPDYAIILTAMGSSAMCILVDRERKVIVADSVKSAYSDLGSWAQFQRHLENALEEARRLDEGRTGFDFVIRGLRKSVV